MLESILGTPMTVGAVALCSLASLICGCIIALFYKMANKEGSNHFLIALLLLPPLVQLVIMMVNGNLGAGVAVAGAFSLVRFRSAQGSAQEICIIFLAMATGLTCGMGYVFLAIPFAAVMMAVFFGATKILTSARMETKTLRILAPEDVDYATAFEDLFAKYTSFCRLERTKTSNMGSLFQLTYQVRLRKEVQEKEFLDEIRCRNGNLTVSLMTSVPEKEKL